MNMSFYTILAWVLFAIFDCTVLISFYIQHKFYVQLVQKHSKYFKSIGSPLGWGGSLDDMARSSVLTFKMLFKRLPPDVANDPIIDRLSRWERKTILIALIIWITLFFVAPRY